MNLDPLRPIFGPAVMVLDAQFRVLQLMAGFTTKDVGPSGSKPGIMVEGEMYVGDLTQNAAYLVVLTTDALRSLNAVSKGERIHGFSPIGTVELEIRSAPFLALPVHYRGSAMRVDPGRPLSGDLFWRANTLFIDSSGLHYVEDVDGRWIERLSIPNTNLVAARVRVPFASNARLELDTAQGPGSPLVRQTFAILPPLGSSAYELDHVAGIVA